MTDKELIAKSQKIIMESRKELENTGLDFVDRFLSELDKAIEHIDAPTTTDKKPDGNQDKLKLNTLMDDLGDWIYSMAFKLTEVKKSHQLLNENEQLKNKKEKDKYQSIEEILFNLASILRDYCVEETKKSNERANFFMGVLYNFGICVEQDNNKAETYLERAALKNHISSQEALSQICYLKNEFEKSAKWIKRMANQGMAEGQAAMGMYYLHGVGVEENDEIAFQWFKKAAEQNDSDGQNMLGPMALSNIMEFQKINPLFVFLVPCYEIAYYLGKARILNFDEQDYPEVDYKFYKPLKADKQKEIEKEGLYEYFDTVIKKFFNSTTIDDFASHIEKILEKCPSYDKPVFRATQIGDKETFNYFLAEYEVGNVVENFGFWSATKHYIPYDKSLVKNKEEADTQLVYMQIDGYSGKEVLYGEIIFPRHKQFLVTARRISDLNVTQIILKEIDPI